MANDVVLIGDSVIDFCYDYSFEGDLSPTTRFFVGGLGSLCRFIANFINKNTNVRVYFHDSELYGWRIGEYYHMVFRKFESCTYVPYLVNNDCFSEKIYCFVRNNTDKNKVSLRIKDSLKEDARLDNKEFVKCFSKNSEIEYDRTDLIICDHGRGTMTRNFYQRLLGLPWANVLIMLGKKANLYTLADLKSVSRVHITTNNSTFRRYVNKSRNKKYFDIAEECLKLIRNSSLKLNNIIVTLDEHGLVAVCKDGAYLISQSSVFDPELAIGTGDCLAASFYHNIICKGYERLSYNLLETVLDDFNKVFRREGLPFRRVKNALALSST